MFKNRQKKPEAANAASPSTSGPSGNIANTETKLSIKSHPITQKATTASLRSEPIFSTSDRSSSPVSEVTPNLSLKGTSATIRSSTPSPTTSNIPKPTSPSRNSGLPAIKAKKAESPVSIGAIQRALGKGKSPVEQKPSVPMSILSQKVDTRTSAQKPSIPEKTTLSPTSILSQKLTQVSPKKPSLSTRQLSPKPIGDIKQLTEALKKVDPKLLLTPSPQSSSKKSVTQHHSKHPKDDDINIQNLATVRKKMQLPSKTSAASSFTMEHIPPTQRIRTDFSKSSSLVFDEMTSSEDGGLQGKKVIVPAKLLKAEPEKHRREKKPWKNDSAKESEISSLENEKLSPKKHDKVSPRLVLPADTDQSSMQSADSFKKRKENAPAKKSTEQSMDFMSKFSYDVPSTAAHSRNKPVDQYTEESRSTQYELTHSLDRNPPQNKFPEVDPSEPMSDPSSFCSSLYSLAATTTKNQIFKEQTQQLQLQLDERKQLQLQLQLQKKLQLELQKQQENLRMQILQMQQTERKNETEKKLLQEMEMPFVLRTMNDETSILSLTPSQPCPQQWKNESFASSAFTELIEDQGGNNINEREIPFTNPGVIMTLEEILAANHVELSQPSYVESSIEDLKYEDLRRNYQEVSYTQGTCEEVSEASAIGDPMSTTETPYYEEDYVRCSSLPYADEDRSLSVDEQFKSKSNDTVMSTIGTKTSSKTSITTDTKETINSSADGGRLQPRYVAESPYEDQLGNTAEEKLKKLRKKNAIQLLAEDRSKTFLANNFSMADSDRESSSSGKSSKKSYTPLRMSSKIVDKRLDYERGKSLSPKRHPPPPDEFDRNKSASPRYRISVLDMVSKKVQAKTESDRDSVAEMDEDETDNEPYIRGNMQKRIIITTEDGVTPKTRSVGLAKEFGALRRSRSKLKRDLVSFDKGRKENELHQKVKNEEKMKSNEKKGKETNELEMTNTGEERREGRFAGLFTKIDSAVADLESYFEMEPPPDATQMTRTRASSPPDATEMTRTRASSPPGATEMTHKRASAPDPRRIKEKNKLDEKQNIQPTIYDTDELTSEMTSQKALKNWKQIYEKKHSTDVEEERHKRKIKGEGKSYAVLSTPGTSGVNSVKEESGGGQTIRAKFVDRKDEKKLTSAKTHHARTDINSDTETFMSHHYDEKRKILNRRETVPEGNKFVKTELKEKERVGDGENKKPKETTVESKKEAERKVVVGDNVEENPKKKHEKENVEAKYKAKPNHKYDSSVEETITSLKHYKGGTKTLKGIEESVVKENRMKVKKSTETEELYATETEMEEMSCMGDVKYKSELPGKHASTVSISTNSVQSDQLNIDNISFSESSIERGETPLNDEQTRSIKNRFAMAVISGNTSQTPPTYNPQSNMVRSVCNLSSSFRRFLSTQRSQQVVLKKPPEETISELEDDENEEFAVAVVTKKSNWINQNVVVQSLDKISSSLRRLVGRNTSNNEQRTVQTSSTLKGNKTDPNKKLKKDKKKKRHEKTSARTMGARIFNVLPGYPMTAKSSEDDSKEEFSIESTFNSLLKKSSFDSQHILRSPEISITLLTSSASLSMNSQLTDTLQYMATEGESPAGEFSVKLEEKKDAQTANYSDSRSSRVAEQEVQSESTILIESLFSNYEQNEIQSKNTSETATKSSEQIETQDQSDRLSYIMSLNREQSDIGTEHQETESKNCSFLQTEDSDSNQSKTATTLSNQSKTLIEPATPQKEKMSSFPSHFAIAIVKNQNSDKLDDSSESSDDTLGTTNINNPDLELETLLKNNLDPTPFYQDSDIADFSFDSQVSFDPFAHESIKEIDSDESPGILNKLSSTRQLPVFTNRKISEESAGSSVLHLPIFTKSEETLAPPSESSKPNETTNIELPYASLPSTRFSESGTGPRKDIDPESSCNTIMDGSHQNASTKMTINSTGDIFYEPIAIENSLTAILNIDSSMEAKAESILSAVLGASSSDGREDGNEPGPSKQESLGEYKQTDDYTITIVVMEPMGKRSKQEKKWKAEDAIDRTLDKLLLSLNKMNDKRKDQKIKSQSVEDDMFSFAMILMDPLEDTTDTEPSAGCSKQIPREKIEEEKPKRSKKNISMSKITSWSQVKELKSGELGGVIEDVRKAINDRGGDNEAEFKSTEKRFY